MFFWLECGHVAEEGILIRGWCCDGVAIKWGFNSDVDGDSIEMMTCRLFNSNNYILIMAWRILHGYDAKMMVKL